MFAKYVDQTKEGMQITVEDEKGTHIFIYPWATILSVHYRPVSKTHTEVDIRSVDSTSRTYSIQTQEAGTDE